MVRVACCVFCGSNLGVAVFLLGSKHVNKKDSQS